MEWIEYFKSLKLQASKIYKSILIIGSKKIRRNFDRERNQNNSQIKDL